MVDTSQALETVNLSHKLSELGLAALLILVLIGGYFKWWVWGWLLAESQAREKEWKDLALTGGRLAETAVDLARRRPR